RPRCGFRRSNTRTRRSARPDYRSRVRPNRRQVSAAHGRYHGRKERPRPAAFRLVSLRARLTLFFFRIAIVPLVLAGVLVRVASLREVDRRTDIKLTGDAQALAAAWNGAAQLAALSTHQAAEDLAGVLDDPRRTSAELETAIARERVDRGLDYLVVTR